ncbi:MAG: hypothetical protein M0Z53_15565, partial [Thermaerobacter sp.]|nr:hypothetical protein [Thermaerobacter sp.]
ILRADEVLRFVTSYTIAGHGRSYPKFGPFKQPIIDCLAADTCSRHQAQRNILLTLKFPVFKSVA